MSKLIRLLLPFVLGFALMGMWMVIVDHGARAHDWSDPRFAQMDQYQKNWMQKQRRPNTTFFCCNEADGDQVDEEIRYDEKGIGHYWINSVKTRGQWLLVPEESIISEPNLHGRALAWFRWTSLDGTQVSAVPRNDLPVVIVFCFMPGPLL